MLTQTSPTLSDGTKITDLVRPATREVQMRVLSDPEIYELEMQRIFGKVWLFLGMASEIPNSGDFVVRDMGSDAVIVSRDKAGEVHVLLNVCSHRGMKVSLLDGGNTQIHKCIYHGWAFRPNGEFIGAPVEKETMHGKITPKAELGLRKARVTVYGGLIFATWNIDGPSLEDFLGDAKWYYDILFKRSDQGLEALCAPTGKPRASNPPPMVTTRSRCTAGWARSATTKRRAKARPTAPT
jgi:phenylpropionate dioxygenase-like ring-hydroxylating dioxygenase large terminal subunit